MSKIIGGETGIERDWIDLEYHRSCDNPKNVTRLGAVYDIKHIHPPHANGAQYLYLVRYGAIIPLTSQCTAVILLLHS